MVDAGTIAVWCWDARPFPFFPGRSDLWADAPNYDLGHWLNGRLGSVLLGDLVAEICGDSNFSAYDVSGLYGLVTGYARTSTMSARDELAPLMSAFFFDSVESQGTIRFVMRGQPLSATIDETNLCINLSGEPNFGFNLTRTQELDLPVESRITFIDPANDYQQGSVDSKRLVGRSTAVATASLPLVMDRVQAQGVGDRLIQEAWMTRDSATFDLPPSFLYLDPTDELQITAGSRARRLRISDVHDTTQRAITAIATDPSLYDAFTGPARNVGAVNLPKVTGRDLVVFLDIPMLTTNDTDWNPHVAAFANPWPSKVQIEKSSTTSNYALDTSITTAAIIGSTMYDFYSGPLNRWDNVNSLSVQLLSGSLLSTDKTSLYGGTNAIAVQNADGYWEILQFLNATLIGTNQYQLTGLIRGRLGTELQMRNPVAASARVVVLDQNLIQLHLTQTESRQSLNFTWGPSDKDISDPAYQTGTFQFQAVGQMPLAPCHVGFEWGDYTPDLFLKWLRRDHSPDATNILLAQTPMSEASEAYEIDIKDGSGNVLRTVTGLTVHSYLYTAAEQTTDFGAPLAQGSTLHLSIYQMSAVLGRGWPATVALSL